jgi:hypothetical protein
MTFRQVPRLSIVCRPFPPGQTGPPSPILLLVTHIESSLEKLRNPVPSLSNLKMRLIGNGGTEIPGTLYGKVPGTVSGNGTDVAIRFTSIPPEIETVLGSLTTSIPLES